MDVAVVVVAIAVAVAAAMGVGGAVAEATVTSDEAPDVAADEVQPATATATQTDAAIRRHVPNAPRDIRPVASDVKLDMLSPPRRSVSGGSGGTRWTQRWRILAVPLRPRPMYAPKA